jgi:Plant transposon protein
MRLWIAYNAMFCIEPFVLRGKICEALSHVSSCRNRVYDTVSIRPEFVRKFNMVNKQYDIHPLQRITAALQVLAYGISGDMRAEYLQICSSSVNVSVKTFSRAVIEEFGEEYLREPNEDDLRRILKLNAARGFPGCPGSIDCQRWDWENCLLGW